MGIILFCICQCGCTILDIKRQSELVSDAGVITGTVKNLSGKKGPIYIGLVEFKEGSSIIEPRYKVSLSGNGGYKINALPGDYFIGAFLDENADKYYQYPEYGTYLGMDEQTPRTVSLSKGQVLRLDQLVIRGEIETELNINQRETLSRATRNIGRITDLNEELFTPENATTGLWQPLSYLEKYGGGLMMLQEYQQDKIPLVLVHGINGTASEYRDLIAELDHAKYQPWVLQYPSGLSLGLVSDYLLDALNNLNRQYEFPEIRIIAHSMGGLVVRSFVSKYGRVKQNYAITLVITINSPLYGMESAAIGVKRSPIVIPSWRDVATESEFVQNLMAWDWPESIPYHLVFSYLPGKPGDGVVPLDSQLSLKLQDESVRTYGFQAEHTAILHLPEFIKRLNLILEK